MDPTKISRKRKKLVEEDDWTEERSGGEINSKMRKPAALDDPEDSDSSASSDSSDHDWSSSSDGSSVDENDLPKYEIETKRDNSPDCQTMDHSEKYQRLCKEEETINNGLMKYWFSNVAPKVRKELYESKKSPVQPDVLRKLHLMAAKKFAGLPLVTSVGVERDSGKINVIVSKKTEALKLSKELTEPNVRVIEAPCM